MIDKEKLITSVKLLERKIAIARIEKIEKLLDKEPPPLSQIKTEISKIMIVHYKTMATIQQIENFDKKIAHGVSVTMPKDN